MTNDQRSYLNDKTDEPEFDQRQDHSLGSQSQNLSPSSARASTNAHEDVRASSDAHEPARASTNNDNKASSDVPYTEFSSEMITILELKKLFLAHGLNRNEVTLRRYAKRKYFKNTQITAADGSSPYLIDKKDALRYISELLQTYGTNVKKDIEKEETFDQVKREDSNIEQRGDVSQAWKQVEWLQSHIEQITTDQKEDRKEQNKLLTDAIQAAAVMGEALRTAVPALQEKSDEEILNAYKDDKFIVLPDNSSKENENENSVD